MSDQKQSPQGSRMMPDAAARIQSSDAMKGDGNVAKGSFSARAQSAAARNAAKGGGQKK